MVDLKDYLDYFLQNDVKCLAYIMICTSFVTIIALSFVTAPYGRYVNSTGSQGWSLSSHRWLRMSIPGSLAWMIQECPCVFIFLYQYKNIPANPTAIGLYLMFLLHYINRTFVFPLQLNNPKPTPFSTMFLAFIFCCYNGYLQSENLVQSQYPDNNIYTPHYIIGTLMFFIGLSINLHSDYVLRNLRKPGETAYKIPQGGLFHYVSGANFFGEIVEWTGFAIASYSLAGFAFALFVVCNIGPRAYHHHQWYLTKFDDYPKNRTAVIPFIF